VNQTVVDKLATQSGIERAKWNAQALINFSDTGGSAAALAACGLRAFRSQCSATLARSVRPLTEAFFSGSCSTQEPLGGTVSGGVPKRSPLGLPDAAGRRLGIGQFHRSWSALLHLCRTGLCGAAPGRSAQPAPASRPLAAGSWLIAMASLEW